MDHSRFMPRKMGVVLLNPVNGANKGVLREW